MEIKNLYTMQVFINDKSFECTPGTTLPEVLEANAIPTGNIAIAVDFNVPTGVKPYFKMVAKLSSSRQYREGERKDKS